MDGQTILQFLKLEFICYKQIYKTLIDIEVKCIKNT